MAVTIPFVRDIAFEYGVCEWVSPLIRRVICNNPSGFTFKGTGTYIVGRGKVAVIDPGPLDEAHVAAILKAVEGETVTHILITHHHWDHVQGLGELKSKTGAKVTGPDRSREVVPGFDKGVEDGDDILAGPFEIKAIGTPVSPDRLRALYFTRATAPAGAGPLYHHIGLYGFRRDALERFVTLPPGVLERREQLEQLRALEAGMRIDIELVDTVPFGVDSPDDLIRARQMLADNAG